MKQKSEQINFDHSPVMPKTTNRFRLLFEGFGSNGNNMRLTEMVVKCSCPSIDFSMDLRQFGLMLNYDKWSDIKLVLRDDVCNVVHDEVTTQVHNQLKDQNISFGIKMQSMDGADLILNETSLLKCRIRKYASNDWDYSSAKPKTITLLISYSIE
jgi:hypothetical protein